jgi:hypothetical protein
MRIESFGADRILLGTYFPYEAGEQFMGAVEYVSAVGVPAEEVNAIMETSASALLEVCT